MDAKSYEMLPVTSSYFALFKSKNNLHQKLTNVTHLEGDQIYSIKERNLAANKVSSL